MTKQVLKTLAKTARTELAADSKGKRFFEGRPEFAAEYVYFKAMREGVLDCCEVRKTNRENIALVVEKMKKREGRREQGRRQ